MDPAGGIRDFHLHFAQRIEAAHQGLLYPVSEQQLDVVQRRRVGRLRHHVAQQSEEVQSRLDIAPQDAIERFGKLVADAVLVVQQKQPFLHRRQYLVGLLARRVGLAVALLQLADELEQDKTEIEQCQNNANGLHQAQALSLARCHAFKVSGEIVHEAQEFDVVPTGVLHRGKALLVGEGGRYQERLQGLQVRRPDGVCRVQDLPAFRRLNGVEHQRLAVTAHGTAAIAKARQGGIEQAHGFAQLRQILFIAFTIDVVRLNIDHRLGHALRQHALAPGEIDRRRVLSDLV